VTGRDDSARALRLAERVEKTRGVLVVGAGGLGCPALSVLAKSGVTRFTLLDDDTVDVSNLQRQTLFDDGDVGRAKVDAAAARIAALSPLSERVQVEAVRDRFVPDNAFELAQGHALILDGADNFATKFLVADVGRIARLPVVQAGAVRFGGWALAVAAEGAGPCVRCVFEDVPQGMAESCAAMGVLGPVVGVLGALQAALALQLLLRGSAVGGTLFSYDALAGSLRRRKLARRADCALCSGQIRDLNPERMKLFFCSRARLTRGALAHQRRRHEWLSMFASPRLCVRSPAARTKSRSKAARSAS
jgi:adenylyltransferase/sulfurtransferase